MRIRPRSHSCAPPSPSCSPHHRELEKVGIQREPSEADFRYLATRAGFVVGADSVRSSSASTAELASFKQWFGGCVRLVSLLFGLWVASLCKRCGWLGGWTLRAG